MATSTSPFPAVPLGSTNPEDYLNRALPGFSDLTKSATGVIGDLLKGLPSPSTARQAEATFGAASGTGAGSEFSNRLGYDLYNEMGQKRQQQGIQDLLSTLGTYSGSVTPNQSQLLQNQQFGSSLLNQQSEFAQTEQDRQNQMLMSLLGQLGINN